MSTVVIRRATRRPAPPIPDGDLVIDPPPPAPRPAGSRWSHLLVALPMLAGTVATALMFAGRDGSTYTYVVGAIFGISSLGMLATTFGTSVSGPRRAEAGAVRDDYLAQLARLRRRVRDTARAQREGLAYRHPAPAALWSLVDGPRLWERRPGDDDFGVVRVGTGAQDLATPLLPGDAAPDDELEPTAADALRRFLRAYAVVPGLPVAVRLPTFRHVLLTGDPVAARSLARAMLAQLCVLHAPGELCVTVAGPARSEWEYVKWLPHARAPVPPETPRPPTAVPEPWHPAPAPAGPGDLGTPYRVTLHDGAGGAEAGPSATAAGNGGPAHATTAGDGGPAHATAIAIGMPAPPAPEPDTLVLHVDADGSLARLGDDLEPIGTADRMSGVEAAALARRLAPLRLAAAGSDGAPANDFTALLGLADPARHQPRDGWRARAGRDRLRVPIGTGADGRPVELDLKEAARHGMGPHGLVVGATGSGKSELLRTLVLALAVSHDPATLNFVLIDFKGGAAFGPLHRLPHTAAVITNLADELPLVDRMAEALNGELVRRQELLRAAGNAGSLEGYERARAADPGLEPLPALLVVCDEFAELLAARPELIELFGQIGRVGRSLGVHLLLASQRLEEGRLRGLDTSLSYRIGLRTFSPMESRAVLGVPDAYHLPAAPGHAYLRHGTGPPVRFRTAYVSGPVPTDGPGPAGDAGPLVRPFTAGSLAAAGGDTASAAGTDVPGGAPGAGTRVAGRAGGPAAGTSVLDALVDRLADAGRPAHQVWLPPLTVAPLLGALPPSGAREPAVATGATTDPADAADVLRPVPVGLVDRPFQQRRDPLWLALEGTGGHLAVVGGPQSGKSTLVRTVLCGLALAHPPDRVQFYCLDFGGGSLGGLRGLPHVGGVAGRQDDAAVRRTVAEVAALLARRERRPADGGPEGAHRATDDPGDHRYGHVFLVIDGWATLRGEYEELADTVTEIGTRGLSHRVHLIVAAGRWMDLRPAVRDLFGSRLELRLGDPADSMVSRRAAAGVPPDCPGRGLTVDGLHFIAARPALSDSGTPGLIAEVSAAWPGPGAPPVRMLPTLLPYQPPTVPAGGTSEGDDPPAGIRPATLRVPVGVAETDLGVVELDFAADAHLTVFGDSGCGKTSFLRALATSIAHLYPPERARLVLVDHRRGLLGAVRTDHLIGYGATAEQSAELLASVARYLRRRLPGPDVTAGQLRDRSWWSGAECFVLVDDHDLTGTADPLVDLLELLPQAADVGLHVVVARRAGGAGRALHDPVPRRLRELGTPGLVMAGSRDEGALVGDVRPRPLPPGRALLVERSRGARLIQLAYLPPPE